jgi:hypothetical protein
MFMYENGGGGRSLGCFSRLSQSIVSDLSRGGVPVFNLEMGNFNLKVENRDDIYFAVFVGCQLYVT